MLVNHTVPGSTTNNSYQSMPDLSQSIGDFNGECEVGGEAEAWLNNLNTTATLHHWPKELKLQMARRHLVGPARDWLLCSLDAIKTWQISKHYSKKRSELKVVILNVLHKCKRAFNSKENLLSPIFTR